MWKAVAVVLIAGVAWLTWLPARVPAQSLPVFKDGARAGEQRVGGTCFDKHCVIVYVAPWCPSCHRSEPMIAELRKTLLREGVSVHVVVGMDQADKLAAYADHLGYPVLLDVHGRLREAAHVKAVPTFVVTDAKGRAASVVTGAYPDVAEMRRRLGV